ncbi:MAG: hypothetical protein ACE366_22455 [Bradymonadia bacterium]
MRLQLTALVTCALALIALILDGPPDAPSPHHHDIERGESASTTGVDQASIPTRTAITKMPALSAIEARTAAPAPRPVVHGAVAMRAARRRYGTASRPLGAQDPILLESEPELQRATLTESGETIFSQASSRTLRVGDPITVEAWTAEGDTPVVARIVARRAGQTVVLAESRGLARADAATALELPTDGVEADDRLSLKVHYDGEDSESTARALHPLDHGADGVQATGEVFDTLAEGHLRLGVMVRAEQPRTVHVAATLYTSSGAPVAYVEHRTGILAGVHEIPLLVAGTVLCDAKVQGPLVVRHVQVTDVTDSHPRFAPRLDLAYTTESYDAAGWSCDDVADQPEAFALGVQ